MNVSEHIFEKKTKGVILTLNTHEPPGLKASKIKGNLDQRKEHRCLDPEAAALILDLRASSHVHIEI